MARYFGLRGKALNFALIWAVIMPAYLMFGYDNGCAGSLVDLKAWTQQFPQLDTIDTKGSTETQHSRVEGTVVALYTLGAFFGSLSCIFYGDRLGRIRTMLLGAVITSLGAILGSSSFSLGQLIVGRLVTGFGLGALTATAPNWQSECSQAEHRGSVVLLEGLFISGGLAIQAWINLGVSHATGSVTWRFPLAFAAFWSLILVVTIPQMPESPRWLLKKGRVEEARQVLAALDDVDPDSPAVERSIHEIQLSLQITGQGKFSDIFRNGEGRFFHRAVLGALGQCFQQMCGINAIAFYIDTIFQSYLGLTSQDARILGASVFTWQTLCSPIGVLTVDRFGRRKLMIVSAIGMGCCMTILAGTVSHPQNNAAIIVAGVAIFMFSTFFPTGFLGLTFLYAAEIAPLSVRVPITSISTASAWLFNFIVAEVTPVGFSTIGWRYYIVYACINFCLILPAVYFFWPETSGRHLEEVDEIFIQSKSIFDPVRISQHMPPRASRHGSSGGASDEGKHVETFTERV